MKPARIALVAVPVILLVALAVQFSIPSEPPTFANPVFSDETLVSILRLVNCGTVCYDIDNVDFISKYPDLEQALGQMDQKYKEKGFDEVCRSNNCVNRTFSNETVAFTTDTNRALAMSADLENAGAKRDGECIEGGCHSLKFRIGDAVYNAMFDYQRQFPPS